MAAAALGILAVAAAVTLWLLRPQHPSVQPPIGTSPQVVQDGPDVAPPEPGLPDPEKDSGEGPTRDGAAPDGEPSAPQDQTPDRDTGEGVREEPPRDDTPRRPRTRPRDGIS